MLYVCIYENLLLQTEKMPFALRGLGQNSSISFFFRVFVLIDSSSPFLCVRNFNDENGFFLHGGKKNVNVQSQSKHLDSVFLYVYVLDFFFKHINKIQNCFIISILNGSIFNWFLDVFFCSSLQHLRLSINLISNSVCFSSIFISRIEQFNV